MTLTARDRKAIIRGSVALLIILTGKFAIIPWLDSWIAARERISRDSDTLNDVRLRVRRILGQRRLLKKTYGPAVVEPLQDLQDAKFSLLQAAQEIFAAGGFKANDYRLQRPRPLPQVPDVQILPIEIPGQCNLAQLLKSLSNLANAKTLIFVDKFSITNDEKKPGKLKVNITLATLARMPKASS